MSVCAYLLFLYRLCEIGKWNIGGVTGVYHLEKEKVSMFGCILGCLPNSLLAVGFCDSDILLGVQVLF